MHPRHCFSSPFSCSAVQTDWVFVVRSKFLYPMQMSPGSVFVELQISSDPSRQARHPRDVVVDLMHQLTNKDSVLMKGYVTRHTEKITFAHGIIEVHTKIRGTTRESDFAMCQFCIISHLYRKNAHVLPCVIRFASRRLKYGQR